ncbi:MAG TPA: tetraacyldisaccharide 4'-kinase [Fimbriimonadaceae bacterium]|jgi:tetraacyldisaccharide 4'-kinase
MHWSEVWYGEDSASKLIRSLLLPASWLYELGWRTYAATYKAGLKKPKHPHTPIVCIGNLTVGGSGKTPLTMYLAKLLADMEKEVVIGCSGYGSPASEEASLAPAGDLSALKWGDEAALFRWKLPQIPLIVGRNRVKAAQICHEKYPGAILLMDDGVQHLPLKKDLIILLDPPGHHRHCLPAGPYREPVSSRSKADLILPGQFKIEAKPMRFIDAQTGLSALKPQTANVLCAIGSPQNFIAGLQLAGISTDHEERKPDHDPLQEGNLFASFPAESPLIVTEKDWVKLRERTDLEGRNILIARHEVSVQPEAEFVKWIQEKLDEHKT